MMNKALKILSVLLSVLFIAALPLFSSFAYDYTYEKIYSDELIFNTNYHIETWNQSGTKTRDVNSPIYAHVPTFYYSDGSTSLSGGVLHTDLFTYLDQNEFDTFQYGFTPNDSTAMYRGKIGHGFRFTNVLERFEQYYDPNFDLVSVTFSFQAVFYLESIGITSSPDYLFNFYSNSSDKITLSPTYTRPFENSYDGTGFLASFDVNFLVSDFETFINDFIGISFQWDNLIGSGETSHGNNQVFVYAFNVMNVTIESGDITLDNVNQSIINGNNVQHQINNKLDYLQNGVIGIEGALAGLNQSTNFDNYFGNVDYSGVSGLDQAFDDLLGSFQDSSQNYIDSLSSNEFIYSMMIYGDLLTLAFEHMDFLKPVFAIILIFICCGLLNGNVSFVRSTNIVVDVNANVNKSYTFSLNTSRPSGFLPGNDRDALPPGGSE